MASPISILNPFHHLARILAALEEARRVADPGAAARRAAQDRCKPSGEYSSARHANLERLGLLRRDSARDRPNDDLDFLSLSDSDGSRLNAVDDLSHLSMSPPTPRRPKV
jgi:hypothetical protein